MSTDDTKVGSQIEFIILLTIYLDEEFQQRGIKLSNLKAALAENKQLWPKVGRETKEENFEKTLDWKLSNLNTAGVLEKKDPSSRDRIFIPGQQFNSYLSKLVGELDETMKLRIKREANGEIFYADYISGKYKNDTDIKHLVMLTDEQANHLARLAHEFGYNFI